MCPHRPLTGAAERYDWCLGHARGQEPPPGTPAPLPTGCWPKENVALLERYQDWLLGGGANEYAAKIIYIPMAGHILGLNLKPHCKIDLERDLDRAVEYLRARRAGKDWLAACRQGVNKFRRFLRLERGLGEESRIKPFDVSVHAQGLPAWLVSELERFQRVRQRSWRETRVDGNTRTFWSSHLKMWRFFCEERQVGQFADLKRQFVLDYVDHRLAAGYAIASVNYDLRNLASFLVFLQDEGYAVPQALLHVPCLKQPDSLPKYLTDEQVRRLRDDFEGHVAQVGQANHLRDALLDRAIFYLLWQCGLRSGEVEELRLEDLDLDGRKITIRDGKGRTDRTVYITDTAIHALREYLEARGMGSGDHVFLFRNAPLKKLFVFRRIHAAGERVGVKVHSHRLRHTCATQLLNAGCRITSIQKFLGHKRLNTTMIYARALDQTVADDYFKAMEQVEQQLVLPLASSKKQVSINEMLVLINSLFKSSLDPTQFEIASTLQAGLTWIEQTRSMDAKDYEC
jgi:integrase/recombinase XerD